MAHNQFYIKQNDTSPGLQVTLRSGDGDAVDVTGSTIVFSMSAGGVTKINRDTNVALTTATSGVVTYSWQANDTDTPGEYLGEFEVTFSGGGIQTYPNSFEEKLEIHIAPEIA